MRYILAIVIFLIAATVYFISRPQPEFEVGKAEKTPLSADSVQEEILPEPEEPAAQAEDKRRALMESEFEKLEKSRRNLERRLNRLKAVLYGKEIPAEERAEITNRMMTGYGMLKNKKLMAMYDSPQAISDEIMRVEYVSQYLEEVENRYRAMRRQQ